MHDSLFLALSLLAAAGAISVVLCRKVVHMAASLIVALSAVAGLFFSMGANFVGATQLMVYVGGTVILLIFGVMLTSMQAKAELKTTPIEAIIALASSAVLVLIFTFTVASVKWSEHFTSLPSAANAPKALAESGESSFPQLALALTGLRPDNLSAHSYLLPFEIISFHLLVVLVAAAYLARPKATQQDTETVE